jgi:hypothetical protein
VLLAMHRERAALLASAVGLAAAAPTVVWINADHRLSVGAASTLVAFGATAAALAFAWWRAPTR